MNVERFGRIGGGVIEARSTYLERLARQAQAAWFAEPTSVDRRHAFAYALLDWGKEVRNRRAIAHARTLLAPTLDGGEP